MNVMSRAHAYARAHRSEFESYKEALRQGLKLAHAEAKQAKENSPHKPAEHKTLYQAQPVYADKAAQIIAEGVRKYRERVPLLLKDWKAEDYNGRRDFRARMR